MKISTKGRYALRLMLDLAEHQNEGFIALKDIAERQNISKKYLEQIVPMLNKAGLLRTNRGYQGGYQLSRQPSEYTLGDILRVTEFIDRCAGFFVRSQKYKQLVRKLAGAGVGVASSDTALLDPIKSNIFGFVSCFEINSLGTVQKTILFRAEVSQG